MRCSVGKVRDALALHDAQSQRQRGLPHELLVYFVLVMVLYASVAYEEVLQLVVEGLRPLLGDDRLAQTIRQQRGHFAVTGKDRGDDVTHDGAPVWAVGQMAVTATQGPLSDNPTGTGCTFLLGLGHQILRKYNGSSFCFLLNECSSFKD